MESLVVFDVVLPTIATTIAFWFTSPSGPGNGGDVFRYRLHSPDGDDLREATYAQMIHPDEEIIAGDNQHFRVLDVVPIDEEDSPPPRRAALARRQHAAPHCGVLVRGSLAIGDRR